jgi:ketosteroid isomerase-like protein
VGGGPECSVAPERGYWERVSENVELARRAFEAFDRRDLDAVLEVCDPDVRLDVVTGGIAGRAEPYRGHDGLREYLSDASRVWTELRMTPSEFHEAAGGVVVVVGRVYARGSGRVVDSPTGWLWRLRDGRIVSGRVYPNPDEALAAAGLADRR